MPVDIGRRIKKRWKQEDDKKRYQQQKMARLSEQMLAVRGVHYTTALLPKIVPLTGKECTIAHNDNELSAFYNDETFLDAIDDYCEENIMQKLEDDPLMTLAAAVDISIAESQEALIAAAPLIQESQNADAENDASVETVLQVKAEEDELKLRDVMSSGMERLNDTRRRLKTGEISLPPPRDGGIGELLSLSLEGLKKIATDYRYSPLLFSVIHSNRAYMYGKQFPGGKDANCFGRLVTNVLQKLDGLLSGGEKRSSIYGNCLTDLFSTGLLFVLYNFK